MLAEVALALGRNRHAARQCYTPTPNRPGFNPLGRGLGSPVQQQYRPASFPTSPWPQVYMFKLVMASSQCSFEWNWETVERDEIQVRSRKCNMQREMGRRTTFYFFQCCCVCKDVFGGCLLRLYLSTISITGSNSTKWVRSRHAMTGSSERYS